ncbi:hypothetical protein VXO74_13570 [Acinetobacter junii]|uniref:hypothetical protein n=1 Tax=Acinetobacter junii TaxID=40215 RepID=UPI003A87750C
MAKKNGFFDELISNFKQKTKETINEILDQSKDTVKSTANNLVEESTKKMQDIANEKLNNVADSLARKQSLENENKVISTQKERQNSKNNDEKFENDLQKNLLGVAKGFASANPKEALEAINNFISTAGEVAKFTEIQKTERKKIECERDITVNKIQAQKDIILAYLEKSFDERKKNFETLFSIVDDAIAKNNMEQLALGLNSINQLAQSSPFKDLVSLESTQAALTDKNHTWDF